MKKLSYFASLLFAVALTASVSSCVVEDNAISATDEPVVVDPEDEEPVEEGPLFSWIGGEEGATVIGGTVVGNGADAESVNYANSGFYTIRVSAKKANIETDNITITLDEPIAEGDVLSITAYRNKDTDANGNLYMLFENGATVDEGGDVTWNNINEAIGQEPNTNTYDLSEAVGSKTIQLARSKGGTNVFILNITIAKAAEAE